MVVTIARQFGSRGRDIGKLLAKKLSVDFYDRKLIELASQKSGISEEYFEKVDEKAGNSLLYALSIGASSAVSSDYGIVPNMPMNDKLYLLQYDIIKKAATKPCVIVGRCADHVLADRKDLVSVFICAEEEARAIHVSAKYNVSYDKAKTMMRKNDKARANYYNNYATGGWGTPEHYDLCLNSTKTGIEGTVEMILSYLRIRKLI